ncbi:hypothetical protein CP969_29850 [Streptomyces viridosporus T7A]|uniref:Uncharacterized protein n=1 Tax=Streptomyces viridosporus T7A TaxID=665577 RepID=A0ABX6AML6_STRVD|nr:hypothetical protein CP969_29850 [Streptomyces viridosporus T7A]
MSRGKRGGIFRRGPGGWPIRGAGRPLRRVLRFRRRPGEVTDGLHSYESTRWPRWPANSFMASVTDPGGVQGGVLSPIRVNPP